MSYSSNAEQMVTAFKMTGNDQHDEATLLSLLSSLAVIAERESDKMDSWQRGMFDNALKYLAANRPKVAHAYLALSSVTEEKRLERPIGADAARIEKLTPEYFTRAIAFLTDHKKLPADY